MSISSIWTGWDGRLSYARLSLVISGLFLGALILGCLVFHNDIRLHVARINWGQTFIPVFILGCFAFYICPFASLAGLFFGGLSIWLDEEDRPEAIMGIALSVCLLFIVIGGWFWAGSMHIVYKPW